MSHSADSAHCTANTNASYFSPVDKVTGRCQVCDKKVAHSSNTTNLTKHLKTTHPESHSELEKRQAAEKVQSPAPPTVHQKTLLESFQKGQVYPGPDSTVTFASVVIKTTLVLCLFLNLYDHNLILTQHTSGEEDIYIQYSRVVDYLKQTLVLVMFTDILLK